MCPYQCFCCCSSLQQAGHTFTRTTPRTASWKTRTGNRRQLRSTLQPDHVTTDWRHGAGNATSPCIRSQEDPRERGCPSLDALDVLLDEEDALLLTSRNRKMRSTAPEITTTTGFGRCCSRRRFPHDAERHTRIVHQVNYPTKQFGCLVEDGRKDRRPTKVVVGGGRAILLCFCFSYFDLCG